MFITADGKTGYYSHERDRDENTGRIYEIKIPDEQQVAHRNNYVKGIIADAANGNPVQAKIELMDLKKERVGFGGFIRFIERKIFDGTNAWFRLRIVRVGYGLSLQELQLQLRASHHHWSPSSLTLNSEGQVGRNGCVE